MILDHHGNPVDLAALREPQTAKVGSLKTEFDRHPARGLTPARLQAILVQAELGDWTGQLELADDIEERDGHVFAELGKRKGAVSALEWDIHAPDKATPAEEALAAEVREWLQGLPEFADVLLDLMDAALKGFSALEMVWTPEPGLGRKVLTPSFTFRPQRWFTPNADRDGLLLRSAAGATRGLATTGEPLLPFGWLAHVHRSRSGYVTRNSLARVIAWPYLFKNYSVRDLAEFLEIFGLPLRLGKYPAGASDDEKQALLRAVVSIGHNAAGIVPQGMAIDFQKAADGTAVPFTAMWDRMEGIESRVILGQTLTAGEGQHGTQALGLIHNEVRMDIRNADARQIEQTLNAQLVRAYCLINHPGAERMRLPRFAFDTGEGEDLALYADNLPKLAKAGLRIGVDWAHKKLRIPKAEDGEDLLQAPAEPSTPAPEAPQPGAKQAKLAAQLPTAPRDALDDLVDAELANWRPMLGPLVQPLLAEIDNALAQGESLQAFAARLPQLVQRMDAQPLADRLARAAFVARLAGEAELNLDT